MMIIVIRVNAYGEYEVPTDLTDMSDLKIYFTDDKDDAIGTAKMVWGPNVRVKFRKGTYDVNMEDLQWD